MKHKHKGIPHMGMGVHIGFVKPSPSLIKGKSKYKCVYYNEESDLCSALNHINCVGVRHKMCKYLEKESFSKNYDEPIPSDIINNGKLITLKEIHTGKEITIKVNSHKSPEHVKLLGRKLKTIVENWEGYTYIVWKIK